MDVSYANALEDCRVNVLSSTRDGYGFLTAQCKHYLTAEVDFKSKCLVISHNTITHKHPSSDQNPTTAVWR